MDNGDDRRPTERHVDLPGTDRRLRFTMTSVRAACRKMNHPFTELWALATMLDLDAITALLYAGLVWEDPKLTGTKVDEVFQQMIDADVDLPEIIEIIGDAIEAGGIIKPDTKVPDDEEKEDEEEDAEDPSVASPLMST